MSPPFVVVRVGTNEIVSRHATRDDAWWSATALNLREPGRYEIRSG
jgi:hypothetical protein